MNLKKLIITGATAALVFGGATGAFASFNYHPKPTPAPLPTTNVSNVGGIDNVSVNVANTGLNFVSAPKVTTTQDKYKRGGDPKTSPLTVTTRAAVALQSTDNQINTGTSGCGCTTGGNTSVSNGGSVSNLSVNVANTGLNWVSGGSLTTGAATAGQSVSNVINTGVGAL
jgi:hypothetical protein